MELILEIIPTEIERGAKVKVELTENIDGSQDPREYKLRLDRDNEKIVDLELEPDRQAGAIIYVWELETKELEPGGHIIDVVLEKVLSSGDSSGGAASSPTFEIKAKKYLTVNPERKELNVALDTTSRDRTPDLPLWISILRSSQALSFDNYWNYLKLIFCENSVGEKYENELNRLNAKRFLPFTDTDSYRALKAATEAFVMVNCGVAFAPTEATELEGGLFPETPTVELIEQRGFNLEGPPPNFNQGWNDYLRKINGDYTIPYLYLVRQKLGDLPLKKRTLESILNGSSIGNHSNLNHAEIQDLCFGLISEKLTRACFLELIWSYWHEECMLVQVLNAISRRFQNIRSSKGTDQLAGFEIGPLQPLNNLLWGYIQDEQHRLTVVRRAYEYFHHYGFALQGKAIENFRPADGRSRFLEAFHKLLNLCAQFYKQEDNKTIEADAFPIRNALREVHLILAEGAHNQYGDLPSTARIEMMMQQYLLARPEFRQFIPTRNMVAYPEPWMDRVGAMNKIMGWTDTSTIHFHNLAVFGEQLLLSIRFGSWSETNTVAEQAAVWANFWRQAVQEYIHAYHGATGVDLGAERTTVDKIDVRPPSFHLAKRLLEQQRSNGQSKSVKAKSRAKAKSSS